MRRQDSCARKQVEEGKDDWRYGWTGRMGFQNWYARCMFWILLLVGVVCCIFLFKIGEYTSFHEFGVCPMMFPMKMLDQGIYIEGS